MLGFSVGSLTTGGLCQIFPFYFELFFSLIILYKPDSFNNIYIKCDLLVGYERTLGLHCLTILPIVSSGLLVYRISYVDSEITL
jgi:hypothetical protein